MIRKGSVIVVVLLLGGLSVVSADIEMTASSGYQNHIFPLQHTNTAEWWNDSWMFRKKITISHHLIEETLVDFPVALLNSSQDFINHAQDDGDDFVLTTEEGTVLAHEIEQYDNLSGLLVCWVKLPVVNHSSDTVLYLYYGNASCASQQQPSAVWDQHYVMVQHMHDNNATGIADSTQYSNDGVKSADPSTEIVGKLGRAQDFEGDNKQYILVDHNSSLNTNGNFTVELWFNPETIGESGMIIHKADSSHYTYDVSNHVNFQVTSQTFDGINNPICYSGINTVSQTDVWYAVTVTSTKGAKDGYKLYLNNDLKATDDEDTADVNTSNPLNIGRRGFTQSLYFDGAIDELRISDIPRSRAWVNTTYQNQVDPKTFCQIGSEEQLNHPPNPPSNPSPSDGARNVSIFTNLEWQGSDPDENDTVTYDVFFGTQPDPALVISNTTETLYDPSEDLAFNTTYYWKIRAWDTQNASTTGPLWSFTTEQLGTTTLELRFVELSFGNLCITIENTGRYDAVNINWTLGMQSIPEFPSIPSSRQWNNTIPLLQPGTAQTVCSEGVLFGLGFYNTQAEADAFNAEPISADKKMILFTILIFLFS